MKKQLITYKSIFVFILLIVFSFGFYTNSAHAVVGCTGTVTNSYTWDWNYPGPYEGESCTQFINQWSCESGQETYGCTWQSAPPPPSASLSFTLNGGSSQLFLNDGEAFTAAWSGTSVGGCTFQINATDWTGVDTSGSVYIYSGSSYYPSPNTLTTYGVHCYGLSGASLNYSANYAGAIAVSSGPATPTGFVVSVPASCGSQWLNLSWNSVAGATSYQVYRDGSLIYNSSLTAFSDTGPGGGGLVLGSYHTYTVNAVNTWGKISGSASAAGTVQSACAVNGVCGSSNGANFYSAPATNLCTAGSASAVSGTGPWTWSCVGSGTGHTDASCSANKTVDCVGSWGNTGTCSASCGGGVLLQSYTISTAAANGGAACPYANGATQWGGTSCNTTVCAPATPTGLSVTPSTCSNNWLNLSWNASAGATSYDVYRGGVFILNTASTAVSNTGLTLGQSYSYTVIAKNAGGSSAATGSVSGTVAVACTYTITINNIGTGSGTSGPSGSYNIGTVVTLTNSPSTGSFFGGWSGDADCADGSVTMNVSKSCTATFTAVTVSVSATTPYTKNPSASNSFAYTPTTNIGSTECRLLDYLSSPLTVYQASSPITYSVPGSAGVYSYYVQCRNTSYTTVIASSPQIIVNVNYAPTASAGVDKAITLPTSSVSTTGTSSDSDGTIASNVWSFISGPITPIITSGTTLSPTFSAMSTAGTYVFRLTTTDNLGLTATDDMNVVVSAVPTYILSIATSGTGSGTAGPAGSYPSGTVVSLTNSPNASSNFAGWSGDADCTDGSVTMSVAKSCTATFTLNNYNVTPSAGVGGTILPNTPQSVTYGNTTSFLVAPSGGYHIDTVSGCGGVFTTSPYTTGTITGNCSVSATFAVDTTYGLSNNGNISIIKSSIPVSGSNSVTRTSTGGAQVPITLAVTGLPAGVTVSSITSNPCTPTLGGCTSTINYSVAPSTVANLYTITVTGTGAGAPTVQTTFILTIVSQSSINISSNVASSWCFFPGNVCGSGTSGSYLVSPSGGTTYTVIADPVGNYDGPTYYNDVTKTATGSFSLFGGDSSNVTLSYSPSFNYSLSKIDPAPVTRGGVDVYTQGTLNVNLISGTTQVVDIIASGAPVGVSVIPSPVSCTPDAVSKTCQSVVTFTIPPGTLAGTYPITFTGSPLNKTVNMNLIINNPTNITATCVASPVSAVVGEPVTWTATNISGGNGNYTSFVWRGVGVPTSPAPNTNPFTVTYTTADNLRVATVTITDSIGNHGDCSASGSALIKVKPKFKEQ